MTPSPSSLLREVGTLLYGHYFLTPLSLSLRCPLNHPDPGVNYDNLRAWVRGSRSIPSWVWEDLGRLIQERREELGRMEREVCQLADPDLLRLTSSIDSEEV